MDTGRTSVRVTAALVALNGLFWLGFAASMLLGFHPAPPGSRTAQSIMSLLAALCGLVLLLLLARLRRSRLAYYLLLLQLGVLGLLTVMDQFGLADLAFLALTIAPLILLVRDRRVYLPGGA